MSEPATFQAGNRTFVVGRSYVGRDGARRKLIGYHPSKASWFPATVTYKGARRDDYGNVTVEEWSLWAGEAA